MPEDDITSRLGIYCAQIIRLGIKLPFWLDLELRMREALADLAVEKCPCAPIYESVDELLVGSDSNDVIGALATSELKMLQDFSRECREYAGEKGFAAAVDGARHRLRNVVR